MNPDLTRELHLLAGLGALCFGAAAQTRGAARPLNRLFLMLCAALALWNLGYAIRLSGRWTSIPWTAIYLFGSCLTAPLALHFSIRLVRAGGGAVRLLLGAAYALSLMLWLSQVTLLSPAGAAWNFAAMAVLGGILATALVTLARHLAKLPRGARRRAHALLLSGACLAVVGGISDFLPRSLLRLPKLGPITLLVFLLILCAVLVRHRFLDVDLVLVRAVVLLAGAAVATVLIIWVYRLSGGRRLPLFLMMILLLWGLPTAGRAVLAGATTLLRRDDPVLRALLQVSRRLGEAESQQEVWAIIAEGVRMLPGTLGVAVYARGRTRRSFRPVAMPGPPEPSRFPHGRLPALDHASALPQLLESRRAPITRQEIELESLASEPDRRALGLAALQQMEAIGGELVVPLIDEEQLRGWIVAGGGVSPRYLGGEVPAALLAVAHQVGASLERIEAAERARRSEALAAVGELAAGLAHEVRNPAAAIHGAVEVIDGETAPAQMQEMLGVIREEAGRLGCVVGDFLDYARPGPPQRQPVDLGELLRSLLRGVGAAGNGLLTDLAVAPGTPRASVDPDRIGRVFLNVIRNARDAAGEDGHLWITVGHEAGRVVVRFQDDGPGIPSEEMPHLFEPFHTTKAGGTGLGLALAGRIVEDHGGEIYVEQNAGSGAIFVIVLPAAEAEG